MIGRRNLSAWIVAASAFFALPGVGSAALERIDVYPKDIHLSTSTDRQAIVVVATRDDGVTIDATSQAKLTLADETFARIDAATLYPKADGETTLEVEFDGQKASVPVKVVAAGAERPISFKLDVMPVFMRSGCNTGSCHGAARGKDGFRLSLFGFDPDGDHFRLTREIAARRINLAIPEDSLMMQKSDGTVPHTGGKRFDRKSEYYETLRRWLLAGAPADPADVAKPTSLELYPPSVVLEGEAARQQFIARAKYSDGTDRDVTNLAVFMSNNDNSAKIDPDGKTVAGARGEAFVMARFATFTVGSQVLVLPADLKFNAPTETPVNYIDEFVGQKLRKLRIEPSGICSDEIFLRRVTLDVVGRLPSEDEYRAFLDDPAPDKRAQKIDQLLEQKEFSELWAMKWAELLMIRSSNRISYKSMFLYSSWLSRQIADNVPLDKMVRDLLSASGGTFKSPATNYYQNETDTLKTAENVAQAFLGFRTQCAQCHNHPFDRWTMDDYYGFAAFFVQIGRKQGEDYRETIVFNRNGGDVRHPVGNAVVAPKFLGGEAPDLKGKDRRLAVAEWIASPENPYFAKNISNRVWDHFFGLGIVDPVDDVRVSNPPSNPELLDALGEKLIEYNYDLRSLVRDVCNSNTYQRETARNDSNRTDETNFAHSRVRRIKAEVLLDCISQATETKDKFRGLPLGARAVEIADGQTSSYFLDTFGRSPRETVCACEASIEPTLSQALHLLNGPTVENKIRQGGVTKAMLEQGPPDEAIRRLYMRCLSRSPSDHEMQVHLALVAANKNPEVGLQDVFWALLNSREFVFNH